jgi:hypothetical protein
VSEADPSGRTTMLYKRCFCRPGTDCPACRGTGFLPTGATLEGFEMAQRNLMSAVGVLNRLVNRPLLARIAWAFRPDVHWDPARPEG